VDTPAAAHALAARFGDLLGAEITGAQRLLVQPGSEALAQFQALPPMLQRAAQAGGLAASLRAQLAALQQEEAQWLSLQTRYQQLQGESSAGAARSEAGQELPGSIHTGGAEGGSDVPVTFGLQRQQEQQDSRPEEHPSQGVATKSGTAAPQENIQHSRLSTVPASDAEPKDLTGLRATRSAVRGSMTVHVSRTRCA
jgi:hypothetical protein